MTVPGRGMLDKLKQDINLPALVIVGLVHGMLLAGTVSPVLREGSAYAESRPSLQVVLLTNVPHSPPVLLPVVPDEAIVQRPPAPAITPLAGPASDPPLTGMPIYYPASALTRMPEVEGFFDIPVPPGLSLNGQVELRLWIDATGKLGRIAVMSSALPAWYEEAAVAAFQKMNYRPGQIESRSVAAFVDIVVEMKDAFSTPATDLPLP